MRITVKTVIEVDDKVCLLLLAWMCSDLRCGREHQKVSMIKAAQEALGLGLREARDVVDSLVERAAISAR